MVDWKPNGWVNVVTPYIVVKDAAAAIDFYKKAFNAEETMRMPGPNNKIMHAEVKIGDHVIMLADEMPEMKCVAPQTLGGSPVSLFLYVQDVDKAFQQAVQAGGKSEMSPADMFWGDRYGTLVDPFGHRWSLATHKEDPTPEEMQKRQQEMFAKQMAGAKK